jgi:hypothetical protein
MGEEDKRPTERAADYFSTAINKGYLAGTGKSVEHLGWAVNNMAAGLYQMNRGLRATYILLEEVNQRLKRLEAKS